MKLNDQAHTVLNPSKLVLARPYEQGAGFGRPETFWISLVTEHRREESLYSSKDRRDSDLEKINHAISL